SIDPGIFKRFGPFDWAKLVHAEQGVELLRPLPPQGAVLTTTRIADMFDKGKAAVVVTESESVDEETGEPMFRARSAFFIGGAGGWGGDRGPSATWQAPDRAPDHTVTYATRPDQALLYRLSGDRNPLHSDPAFARRAGFDRPILHGLCTYGFTGRALLHTMAGGEAHRLRSRDARFAAPVLPGETLHVDIRTDGEGEALVQTRTEEARRCSRDAGTSATPRGPAAGAGSPRIPPGQDRRGRCGARRPPGPRGAAQSRVRRRTDPRLSGILPAVRPAAVVEGSAARY